MLAERLFRLVSLFALGIGVAVVATQGLGSAPSNDNLNDPTLQVVARKLVEVREVVDAQSINQGQLDSNQAAQVPTE